jgi:hypothetical protein
MTEEDHVSTPHSASLLPPLSLNESFNGLSPIKTLENDYKEDEKSTFESIPSFSTALSRPIVENIENDDVCDVSRGLDSLDLANPTASEGLRIDDTVIDNDHTPVTFEPAFSPVKSPKKKMSRKSMEKTFRLEEETLPTTTTSYLIFKITRDADEEEDFLEDSMMDTVRSIFKAILKLCNQVGIVGPSNMNLPTIYDNTQLPKKLETRAIRKWVHFGRMTPENFIGKILVEHSEQRRNDFFTSSAEMLKLMD